MAPSKLKLQDAQDLFQIDSTGSASVRQRLQTDAKPHPRKGASRPLKSSQIIAEARGGSSRTPAFLAKTARQREKDAVGYNKDLHAKLQRIVKRKQKVGQGLWGVSAKEGESEAGIVGQQDYDVWSAPSTSSAVQVRVPKTLHTHHLLVDEATRPAAVAMPHPGQSYNPTATAHSSLIDQAYKLAQGEDEGIASAQALKTKFESMRKEKREAWQQAEDDVGSGAEEDVSLVQAEIIKKVHRRKTEKERKCRLQNITAEKRAQHHRKILKLQKQSLSTLPSLVSSISKATAEQTQQQSDKAAALQHKLATEGLTSRYLGKGRVPAMPVNYQLGEELSESLRGLKSEGNLFREFQASALRRGKFEASKKRFGEKKRKERKTKSVERYDFKRFDK